MVLYLALLSAFNFIFSIRILVILADLLVVFQVIILPLHQEIAIPYPQCIGNTVFFISDDTGKV